LRFQKGVFAMGLQGGFSQLKANYTAVQLSGDGYDPAFSMNANQFTPTLGAGVFYNTDKFYAGLSAPHILNSARQNGPGTVYQNNQWFLTAGYVFDLSPDVALKTSTLARMVQGAPITVDLNANAWFYNTVAIGASVRTSKMIVGMLEIQANRQFRFGYAYDYTAMSAIKGLGSHEVMLRYEFGYEKKGMMSPRHF
jgi:type IX secretion system PorP/SprF family membrane protein